VSGACRTFGVGGGGRWCRCRSGSWVQKGAPLRLIGDSGTGKYRLLIARSSSVAPECDRPAHRFGNAASPPPALGMILG